MKIFYNTRIRTLNPKQPFASALAVENDRIVAVGSDEEIKALTRPGTVIEDLSGYTVWPGLTDAHLHLENYAQSLDFVDCETPTLAECLRRVAERCQTAPEGAWVRGHGWNQNLWPEGFGSAADLDAISNGHPIYLTAKSLHASWANSKAMEMAGITINTKDPEGGTLGRDPHGKPSGILFENAVALVERIIPSPNLVETKRLLQAAQQKLLSFGLTGAHDFDGVTCFAALQELDQEQILKLRMVKSIPRDLLPHAAALQLHTGFGSDHLRIGSLKLFADGALGPRTAAMLQPYEGETEYRGMSLMDAEEIFEIGRQAVSSGISIATHAIGDRANHEVINAYEQIMEFEREKHLAPGRHRIEHVQVIHPEDQARLARLGIIASVQPIHATSDMHISDHHWGARSANAYAYYSLLKLGSTLAFGSDAPVESPNPFFGLHAAITRTRPDGTPGPDGWYPLQKLPLDQAILGYTQDAAFAGRFEDDLGRLSAGFLADFIVLERDPFDIPPADIFRIQPLAVCIGGDWAWRR